MFNCFFTLNTYLYIRIIMNKDSVHLITGLGSITNPENINSNITSFDLKQLEKHMISGGLMQSKTKDPLDKFDEDLAREAKKLGIDFGTIKEKPEQKSSEIKQDSSYSSMPQYSQPDHSLEKSSETEDEEESSHDENADSVEESAESTEAEDPESVFTSTKSPTNYPNQTYSGASQNNYPSVPTTSPNRFSNESRSYMGGDLYSHTQEQQRKQHIDSVISNSSNFSFEREKREDLKCAMLSEIDILIAALKEENIDISRVPIVDRNSDYELVDTVLKMLRHKNDNTRYCGFAEEFLLMGACALEEIFNGERVFFGRYRPDLTGWSNHVNCKLRRMRTDTSQIVSTVMQDYNIGPGFRVLLELVPNMFMYARTRSQQHDQPSLYTEESMQNSINNLRNDNV